MTIHHATVAGLVERLPNQVSGPNWMCFVSDVLDDACNFLAGSNESVRDWRDGVLERLTPSYHKDVWQLCHDLSLWANDSVENKVLSWGLGTADLTNLCRWYVHAALLLVADAVVAACNDQ
jgi:hypothetical protein